MSEHAASHGRALRRGLAPLCLALAVGGCVPRTPPTVTRVLAGERTRGAFVSPYAYEHYLRAEMASARGAHAEAAREFAAARLGAEDDPFLAAREAESFEAAGEPSRADRVLAEGHRLDPSSEAVWLAEGRILAARGDRAGAARAFSRAIEVAPRSSLGPLALSALQRAQGAQDEALATLTAYLSRAPGQGAEALKVRLRVALTRGDLDAASSLAEALGTRAQDDAERRRLTELALSRGRPAAAARFALSLRAPTDGALALRALMAAGRRPEALALLRRHPLDAFADARVWARFVLTLEDAESATAQLEEAATGRDSLRPELAQAQLRAGHLDDALDTLAPLSAQPNDELRRLLGEALRRGGLGALATELLRDSHPAAASAGREASQ